MKKIFFQKIAKTRAIQNIDNDSINSRNYASAYFQTSVEVLRLLMTEKNQKSENLEKVANIFKIVEIWGIKILKNIPLNLEKNAVSY